MHLSSIESKNKFMNVALEQAKIAKKNGEIPVGAVIVKGEKIVSAAFNRREKLQNSLAHAEIIAINLACKKLKNWRLLNCEIFVNLQPCLMCLGAIVKSRIGKIVYGSRRLDYEGTLEREILNEICFINKIEIESGLLASESDRILKQFFEMLRKKI